MESRVQDGASTHFLPVLVSGDTRCRVPLLDASSDELLAGLLQDGEADRVGRLAELLEADPFVALWCTALAGRWGGRLRDIRDLASWLSRHGPSVLKWSPEELQAETWSAAPARRAARRALDRAAADRETSDDDGLPGGVLRAFLTEAPVLLAACRVTGGDGLACLPDWAAALSSERPPLPKKVPPIAGAERLWRGAGQRKARPLGLQLFSKSLRLRARADQLEQRFASTLQQEKLLAMKELAYGASHEINNPLNNISLCAQTLIREEVDPERRRKLASIEAQADRATAMIADMMLFANPPQMETQPFVFHELVHGVLRELAGEAEEQGTRLGADLPEEPCEVIGDAVRLGHGLRAVCRNALEALGAGGCVEVAVVDDPHGRGPLGVASLHIEVRDNGPGLTERERRHLFDPFFCGKEAGRRIGMGLPKCWRIVDEHGGRMEVASEPGKGTIVAIDLPRRPAAGRAA